jgi:hypothetical protein
LKAENEFLAKAFSMPLWVGIVSLFGIVFIGIFPAYWNTKILGQYRTVNTAYFFFIIGWFYNVGCYRFKYLVHPINNQLKIIMLVAVLITMAGTKNGYNLWTDLLYKKVQTFDAEMCARDNEMARAAAIGKDSVLLAPLSKKPATLFVLDLTPDPNHWINTSYASFFGLTKVSLKK